MTHVDEPLALPAPEQPLLLPAPPGPAPRTDSDEREARRRRRKVIAIAAIVLVALLLVGWFFHHRRDRQAKEAAERERNRLPVVSTVAVEASPPLADLRLPGSISPLTEASLFARASGYLKTRDVDIGDRVRKGQVLAEIDAPDLDQQVAMARQQVSQAGSAVNDARARVDLSRVTYLRLLTLVKDQAVAQQQVDQAKQDLDTANAGLASSIANVGASRANLARLAVLQGFEKLRAPFDGVVTARSVDVGALVNGAGASSAASGVSGVGSSASSSASSGSSSGGGTGGSTTSSGGGGDAQGGSGGAATELFRIAQADTVRVFVTVPQESAAALEPNDDARVYVQGFDEPFDGRLTRTSQSLDPSARTLLVEVQVPNPRRALVPGMYAEVAFRSPRQGTPLLVPGEAVIARADGLHVAVLEALRPEDRDRLPKRQPPPDDDATKKGGGDASSKKSGKQAQSGGGAQGGDSKKGEKDDDKGGSQGSRGQGAGGADAIDDDPSHAKRIHLQQVQVGRDYGTEIEITRGLQAGATVVANPGDEVTEGAFVIPHPRKPKGEAGDGGGPPAGTTAKASSPPPGGPANGSSQPAATKPGPGAAPQGIQSPSMEAPTKGRK